MRMKRSTPKCIIVGAGDFSKDFLSVAKEDYMIAADGGLEHLASVGITPRVWIGDMDSTKSFGTATTQSTIQVIKMPREKDDTDTLAAIRLGITKGYKDFALYGMLGGRLDHTLANISCLQFLKKQNARGILYGKDTIVLLLEKARLSFAENVWGMVSVFAWGKPATGVSEEGLLYEIENATLTPELPIGVSNELIGRRAAISVQSGTLLISMIPDKDKTQSLLPEKMFAIETLRRISEQKPDKKGV